MTNTKKITVSTTINAGIDKVWEAFTQAEQVKKWNFASEEWHSPAATNDLRPGGSFTYRMEAKDGSFGFDFGGIYDAIEKQKHIAYTLGDGRKVTVDFSETDGSTSVVETFDAETQNPVEMQQQGWQAILDNLKKHVEGS